MHTMEQTAQITHYLEQQEEKAAQETTATLAAVTFQMAAVEVEQEWIMGAVAVRKELVEAAVVVAEEAVVQGRLQTIRAALPAAKAAMASQFSIKG